MLNVMIVDDEARTRRVLTEFIEWKQINAKPVVIASNGLEAIEALKNNVIDVIISDIRMPFVDGLELARFIKTNNLNIRVILVSAYAEFEYAQSALKYDVTDYILKPLNTKKLKDISNIIKNIHSQKENTTKNFLLFNNNLEFASKLKSCILGMNEQSVYNIISEFLNSIDNIENNIKVSCSWILHICINIAREHQIDILEFEQSIKILEKTPDLNYFDHTLKSVISLINSLKIRQSRNKTSKVDVQSILNYISIKISDHDLSASKIANHFNVSISHLCNKFKENSGTTINKTIIQLRMEYASALLLETTMPIHNISILVGYENIQYFNKLFKRYYGISPSDYRNRGGKI